MKRLLTLALCSTLVVLAGVRPALACINDREVESAEREFRSAYPTPAPVSPAPPPPSPSLQDQIKLYAPLTMGGLLLVGAIVQTVRRVRQ